MRYRIKYKDAQFSNSYSFGGNMQTQGGNFTTGVTHIDAGGTHEESPYEGVPMGQDSEGTPNLVEEQEVMYNDYVFSQRLKVPEIKKPFNGKKYQQYEQILKKYGGKSYAEAVKKAEKDSGIDERPNDPISKRGFEAILEVLMMSQEQERDIAKYPEQASQIKRMTPEEYQEYKDNRNEQEKQQEAEEEKARMQGPIPPEMQQGQQQGQQISPEEQAYQQQQQMQQQAMQDSNMQAQMPQQAMDPQMQAQMQPQMAAYGGRIYAAGGEIPVDQAAPMQETPQDMEQVPQEEMPVEEPEPQTEAAPAPFNGDTPAEEMSTRELNETIEEIIQYAKENKDRALLREARKAKRGNRDDKEAFVDDAREDIAMQEEEAAAQEEQAPQSMPQEEMVPQEVQQAATQMEPQQAAMAAMMGGMPPEMTPVDAGDELNATDPMPNSYALGGSMNMNDPEGGSLGNKGKKFSGTPDTDTKDVDAENSKAEEAPTQYYWELTDKQREKLDRAIQNYINKIGLTRISNKDLNILRQEQAKVLVEGKGKKFNYRDLSQNVSEDKALTSVLKDYTNDVDYRYGRELGSRKLTVNSNGKLDVDNTEFKKSVNPITYNSTNDTWSVGGQEGMSVQQAKDMLFNNPSTYDVYDYKDAKDLSFGDAYDWKRYKDQLSKATYAASKYPEKGHIPYNPQGTGKAQNLEKDENYKAFWERFVKAGLQDFHVQEALKLLQKKTGVDYSTKIKDNDALRKYLFGESGTWVVPEGKKAGVVNDGKEGYWHKYADGVLAAGQTPASGYITVMKGPDEQYIQVERPEGFDITGKTPVQTYTDSSGRSIKSYLVDPVTHDRKLVQTASGTVWDIGDNTAGLETNPDAPYQDEESKLGNSTTTTWYKPKQQGEDQQDPYPAFPEWGDWAQIGVNAGLGIANALTPVDYSNADAIINAARNINYEPVHRTPLGNYLTYKPIDFNYLSNQMQAKANATERALLNQSNGNRATASANLLASNYQNQIAVGDALMKAIQQNREHEANVKKFNRETDQYNSESGLKADMANQSASLQAQQARFNGIVNGYAMRQSLEDAKSKALSANIQGALQGVNNLMHDRYNNKAAGWLARHNYNPGFAYEKKALGTDVSDPRKALFPRKRNKGFNI